MDIKKDLIILDNSDDFGDDIIKQAIHQQKEMTKKIHILKVVSLANKIEDLVRTDIFKKDGIEIMQLNQDLDEEFRIIEFSLIDKDAEIVANYYDRENNEQAKILFEIFNKLDPINLELVHPQLRFYDVIIELKPGIKDKLLDAFLTEELRKLYDYNKMQIELPDNPSSNTKKIKI